MDHDAWPKFVPLITHFKTVFFHYTLILRQSVCLYTSILRQSFCLYTPVLKQSFCLFTPLLGQNFCLFTPQKTVHGKLETSKIVPAPSRRTTLSSPWSVGCAADKNHSGFPLWWLWRVNLEKKFPSHCYGKGTKQAPNIGKYRKSTYLLSKFQLFSQLSKNLFPLLTACTSPRWGRWPCAPCGPRPEWRASARRR